MRFCSACGAPLSEGPPVTCEGCGARHWRNAKPCAGVLATRGDGRLLLVRRDHDPWAGRWDIPGGFCDEREHPAEAAVREAKEETGLDVEVGDLLGMWLDRYPDPRVSEHDVETTLNIYFHATVIGGVERPQPGEVAAIGWFGDDELPDELAFPDHAAQVITAWQASSA